MTDLPMCTHVDVFATWLAQFWIHTITGDLSCGKTTLIAKLQGNEEPEKGSGLEFSHLTVSDEYREGMFVSACRSFLGYRLVVK